MRTYVLSLGTSITEVRITKMHFFFFLEHCKFGESFHTKSNFGHPPVVGCGHSGKAKAPKGGLPRSRVAGLARELACRLPNFQANGMAKRVWVGQISGTRATSSKASHRDAVLKLF